MKKGSVLAILLMAASLGGCSEYNREDRALGGGLIGAGAGALIGGAAGGGRGALAGAAIGGIGGAIIGAETTPRCRYVRHGRCYR